MSVSATQFTEQDAQCLRERLSVLSIATEQRRRETSLDRQDPFLEKYLSHYGLVDLVGQVSDDYAMGLLPNCDEKIVCQYFHCQQARSYAVIVHGFMDHAGLYDKLIRYFLQRRMSVFVYDQYSHGLSDGKSAVFSSVESLAYTLSKVVRFSNSELAKPYFLAGQSLGGAVSQHYLLDLVNREDNPKPELAILFAPLIRIKSHRFVDALYRLIHRVLNSVPRSFSDNSHDLEFLDFLKNRDSFQPRRISAQSVGAMLRWAKAYPSFPMSDVPTLVIQGTDDDTVAWNENMTLLQTKFPRLTIRYIAHARHHMVKESEQYWKQVGSVMNAQLSTQ